MAPAYPDRALDAIAPPILSSRIDARGWEGTLADFTDIHAALRLVMLGAAHDLAIARDDPGTLEVRTSTDAKTGQPGWFGTVTTKKSYVAYHLIPLYDRPDLAADLSPALIRRRQGKTCFNFKAIDPPLFAELAELTHRVRAALP